MAAVLGLAAASFAAWTAPLRADEDDPSYLTAGAGWFDIIHNDERAGDFRLEYRHGEKLLLLKPWAGVEATSDGAVYGAVGVLLDIYFGPRIVLTPSFGAGLFEEGSGKDLGHVVEFRSQVELAYRFDDRSRFGVAFGHISNASLGDDNPGTEVLNLYYSLPIGSLFGN
jgi:hypothetical protein